MTDSIPVYLLTGALGSGKTTLLNRLLTFPFFLGKKTCLIINEFGDLGIDGQLVDEGEMPMVQLTNGSIFCICIRTDFEDALKHIAKVIRPDCVIAEATGMAEPRDLHDMVHIAELNNAFHVAANLCVIDAKDFLRVAPMLRAVRQQTAWADALLMNRCDLVTQKERDQLTTVLRDMNSIAPVVQLVNGHLDPGFLETVQHTVKRDDPLTEPPDPVFATSFTCNTPVNRKGFEDALSDLGDHLLRLKGQVDFGNGPEFIELAGGQVIVSEDRSIQKIATSPTAFIAIGWRIRQHEFRGKIEAALL